MRFKVTATSVWYDDYDELIEKFPVLNNFSIHKETIQEEYSQWTYDENNEKIKQIMYRDKNYMYIDMDLAETFSELVQTLNEPVIIFVDGKTIEIYDSYRE